MIKFYLQLFVPLSVAVPLGIGAFFYRRLPKGLLIVFYYLIIASVFNLAAILLSKNHQNNMPLLHVYTVVEFTCLAFFFKQALEGSRVAKYIHGVIIAFALLSILNTIFFQSLFSYNSYAHSLEAVLLILFSLVFMYRMLDPNIKSSRETKSFLLVSLALFFYFSGSLFLFLFSESLLSEEFAREFGWAMHATLVLIMYIFFSAGFYQYRKIS